MALEPVTQKILESLAASGLPPAYFLPAEQARAQMNALFITNETPETVGSVVNTYIPCSWGNLGIRIYTPSGQGIFPVFVFFHGGGWSMSNIETHDALCRRITNLSDCIVISVDYRLAPEHKYPAAVDDAYTAMQWAFDNAARLNGDPEKIIVGGDSSGAALAAVVCMMARDRGKLDIAYQVLIYPPTDYYLPGTKSYIENGTGYFIDRDFMIWFWNNYLPSDADLNNPYVCPLRAKDFSNLPPAIVLTCEYDPLRDEGEEYARKLQEAGVDVEFKRYDGMIHGFILQFGIMSQAHDAIQQIASGIKKKSAYPITAPKQKQADFDRL